MVKRGKGDRVGIVRVPRDCCDVAMHRDKTESSWGGGKVVVKQEEERAHEGN